MFYGGNSDDVFWEITPRGSGKNRRFREHFASLLEPHGIISQKTFVNTGRCRVAVSYFTLFSTSRVV
jgi:hypothetical protein